MPELDPSILYPVLAAIVGVISIRFPVVGPILKAILDKLFGPDTKPSPVVPSPVVPAPVVPTPAPAPLLPTLGGALGAVLLSLVRKFLEDKLKLEGAQALEHVEMEALVELRRLDQ